MQASDVDCVAQDEEYRLEDLRICSHGSAAAAARATATISSDKPFCWIEFGRNLRDGDLFSIEKQWRPER